MFLKPLPKSFYTSDDVVSIAQKLLGKVLRININDHLVLCRIIETEAYRGPEDKASHSYNNRYTERTKVMYEEGGVTYIYISYGMHFMLNIVTSVKGSPHAVLIRAVEPLSQIEHIKYKRQVTAENYVLTGGPGKVCQALGINKDHNNIVLYHKDSIISIFDDGFKVGEIISTPRVGMSIHVGDASHWPWRFYLSGNKYVSRPLLVRYNW